MHPDESVHFLVYTLIEQFAGVTRKVIEKGKPVAQLEVKPKPKKKPQIVRDLAYYRTLNQDQLRLEVGRDRTRIWKPIFQQVTHTLNKGSTDVDIKKALKDGFYQKWYGR